MVEPSVFESVFDHAPVGEYLLSPSEDPVILAVNEAFLRASGRTRDGLVGERLFAAFPGDPHDVGDTGLAALRASLARVIATGRADELPLQRYPIRTRRPDGSEAFEERYWRAVSSPIFDATRAIVCIAHRTEDVTEQTVVARALERSTERQTFQLALADRLRPLTSPDDIATTASAMLGQHFRITRVTFVEVDDATGTFVQRRWSQGSDAEASEERRRLDDFGPAIIATLRAAQPLVIGDVLTDPRTRAHADAYASIDVRSNLAIPLVKSAGLSLVLSLQHRLPRDWTEAEVQLATDVAERTWSAAENARAQQQLHEANRRKDEFLAMLAHELRNPLAPISVAADVLTRRSLDEALVRRTSAMISRQVRHMSGLVDDLLDVSRVTRGLITLDESPQDMKSVVAHAAEQTRPIMETNQHRVSLDLSPSAAMVCGDGKRLIQVVSNLMNNAAKYTPLGGHIQVALLVTEHEVVVRVQDDGIGIASDVQPRIFDLFAQADPSADRAKGGLGLGLALVKSLVELHKGKVTVHSDGPGTGSTFTVTFPRLESAAVPGAATDAEADRRAKRSLDVLVVDDNIDAADALKVMLECEGHRVRVEHDPRRALQAATEHPPHVGFIDIGLPSMDGYEVVRRLRASTSTARAVYVAVTGYGQAADRSRALTAGFDEHVVKPPRPEHLLDLLERIVPPEGPRPSR